ncbi:MAG: T9SS type A sorting domain-containing protein [Candidatus Fermentibacteraceae bacterium]|nr:T9SS type A sorting domain-containing protein [Candidatus Fermentibacteraceae bacterium]
MRRFCPMLLSFALPVLAHADSATQTDWSSGPGQEGPVSSWGTSFDCCSSMNWFEEQGVLTLGSDRVDTQITISSGAIGWMWAADMDMDGDQDIIGCDQTAGTIRSWENLDGLGGAWSELEQLEIPWAEELSYVTAADFDGMGQMYIAVSYMYGGRVLICESSWPSYWWDVPLEEFAMVGILLPCDVDEDGDMDLIAQRELSWYWSIEVYENIGFGYSWSSHTQGFIISDMKLADLDGDGDQDIAAARYWGGGVAWYENGPGCNFFLHLIRDTSGACAVGTGDLDGDGDIDIVADFGSMLEWYENDLQGSGKWSVHEMTGLGTPYWPVIALGDFDHDGDVDIARRSSGNLYLAWNAGHGEAWTAESFTGAGFQDGGIRATDLNGDGISDFIASWMTSAGLKWFRFAEPAMEGILTSSILQLPQDPHWGEITWECEEPSGTALAFQVRSSDDPGDLGEWSDTLTVSGTSLQGILGDFDNYCQYRVLLFTGDPDSTPVLQEVSIDYDPLGIPGGERASPEFFPVSPNPSLYDVDLRFYLASEGSVDLDVYDITGRVVRSARMDDLSEGEHTLRFTPPHPGVYFARIRCNEWTGIRRFVAI